MPTWLCVPMVPACCCCCCCRTPSGTFRSADMSIEAHVIRLSRRQCPAACFLRPVRPTTRKKCQFSAKVLACCCYCCCRAPSGTFRGADTSIEARVMRLARRQCPAACFLRLVRPTTRHKCRFGTKVLTCCCCYCRRVPSGTFRIADMSIEARAKRLCRRQCCTACSWHLLRRITLENDEFTPKTGNM